MRNPKYHIYLTSDERRTVINSLIDLRNNLISQGKYTDIIDELLVKLTKAKVKKIKVTVVGVLDVSGIKNALYLLQYNALIIDFWAEEKHAGCQRAWMPSSLISSISISSNDCSEDNPQNSFNDLICSLRLPSMNVLSIQSYLLV